MSRLVEPLGLMIHLALTLVVLLSSIAATAHSARADDLGGGTRGSNGLVPRVTVTEAVPGESLSITIDAIPATSSGLRVFLLFSARYWGQDASSLFGSGARLIPRVEVTPGETPPVSPALEVDGTWPRRTMVRPIPARLGGRTLYIQALVEDPGAQSGAGWTLSNGISFMLPEPNPDTEIVQVDLTPASSRIWAGTTVTFDATMRDAQGAVVAPEYPSDLLFAVTAGRGSFDNQQIVGDRIRVLFRGSARVELSTIRVTELRSGTSRSDTSQVETVPAAPSGAIPLVASPASIPADGSSTTALQGGPVTDSLGNPPFDGQMVTLTTTRGTFLGTDQDGGAEGFQVRTTAGLFTATLRSSTTPGTATVTARSFYGSAQGTAQISMTEPGQGPEVAEILLTPPWANAEVGTEVELTAELRDAQGQMIPATSVNQVVFSITTGTGGLSARSLVSGRVRARLAVPTTREDTRVTAREAVSGDNRTDSSWVYGTPGPPDGVVELTASPDSIPADGTSTSTITSGTIRDAYGNVVADGELFTVTTSLGTIVTLDASAGTPGRQVAAAGGIASVVLRAGEIAGEAMVEVASDRGNASGRVLARFEDRENLPDVIVTGLASLPHPVANASGAVDARTGKLYVFATDIIEIDPEAPASQAFRILPDVIPQQPREISAWWDPVTSRFILAGGTLPDLTRLDQVVSFDPLAPPEVRITVLEDRLPTARSHGTAVWDPTRNVALIFGGVDGNGRRSSSILEYNPRRTPGSRFQTLSDSLPRAASRPAAVHDSTRLQFLILDGDGRDVWSFDPTRPAGNRLVVIGSLPSGRLGASAYLHGPSDQLFVFGGWTGFDYPEEYLALDLGSPAPRVAEIAGLAPEGFTWSTMVEDAARDAAWLLGGNDGIRDLDQVVTFSSGRLRKAGAIPTTLGDCAVHDPDRSISYVFQRNVLEIDRHALLDSTVRSTADAFPEEDIHRAAAWNSALGSAFLFGGFSQSDASRSREIFRYDPSLPAGSRLTSLPDQLPAPRSHGGAIENPSSGTIYVFGGIDSSGRAVRDILRFDPRLPPGQRVEPLVVRLPRSARSLACAFDSSTRLILLSGDGSDAVLAFDPQRETISTIGELPGQRLGVAIGFHPSFRTILAAGGFGGSSSPLAEISVSVGSAQLSPVGDMPRGRAHGTLLFDPHEGDFLLLTGEGDAGAIRILDLRP